MVLSALHMKTPNNHEMRRSRRNGAVGALASASTFVPCARVCVCACTCRRPQTFCWCGQHAEHTRTPCFGRALLFCWLASINPVSTCFTPWGGLGDNRQRCQSPPDRRGLVPSCCPSANRRTLFFYAPAAVALLSETILCKVGIVSRESLFCIIRGPAQRMDRCHLSAIHCKIHTCSGMQMHTCAHARGTAPRAMPSHTYRHQEGLSLHCGRS